MLLLLKKAREALKKKVDRKGRIMDDKFLKFEKIITINIQEQATIAHAVLQLINFMYQTSKFPEYFHIKLTDSEKNPFAKDLIIEWAELKKRDE